MGDLFAEKPMFFHLNKDKGFSQELGKRDNKYGF